MNVVNNSSDSDEVFPKENQPRFLRPQSADAINLRQKPSVEISNVHGKKWEISAGKGPASRSYQPSVPLRRATTTNTRVYKSGTPRRKYRNEIYRSRKAPRTASQNSPSTVTECNELSPRISKTEYARCTDKPAQVTKFLHDALIKSKLFERVDSYDVAQGAIDETIREMYTQDLDIGEILVKQGDEGNAFYIVEFGALDVIMEQAEV